MKTNKILALLLVLLLVAFPFSASAVTDNLTIIDTGEQTVEPLYEPVCGTYPSHRMVSSGFGFVDKDGSAYIIGGCVWQCSRCLLVMVTEGDLYYWGMNPIGYYAILYGAIDPINTNGCYIRKADYYGYTSNNYLPGYKFYLSQ